jgi:hypothetical protein
MRERTERDLLFFAFGLLMGVLLHVAAGLAHEAEHPELDSWFMGLSSGKGPCCDTSEALRLDDPDWENDSGHYKVRIEGEWVDVPPDAVVSGPNKAGHALVWPFKVGAWGGGGWTIRCFMPGVEG